MLCKRASQEYPASQVNSMVSNANKASPSQDLISFARPLPAASAFPGQYPAGIDNARLVS